MRKMNIKDSHKMCPVEISYSEYKKIIVTFIKHLMKLVLQGHKVYLPNRMGSIQVKGKKQEYKVEDGKIKGLAPNWNATMELRRKDPTSKQVIYHTNPNTDGVRYKIKWSKFNIFAKHKGFYWLRFTRTIKRQLSDYIINKTYEYEVL